MKKTLLLLFILGFTIVSDAQVQFTPIPFGVNQEVFVTYGASGDYSLFDPNGEQTLYLYTGLETDGIPDTWDFHDQWSDVNSLIPLVFNSSSNRFEGSFTIGTRSYVNSSTQEIQLLPEGTCINNWYFILRNAAGNQTTNLIGSDYGYDTSSCYLKKNSNSLKEKVIYSNGYLVNSSTESFQVDLYNLLGQRLQGFFLEQNETRPITMRNHEPYIAVLSNGDHRFSIKFIP